MARNRSNSHNNDHAEPRPVEPRYVDPAPGSFQIIPLGGVGEIGKNMWVLRSGDTIIVLDCGFGFATEDMPGVDLLLPDYSYLVAHAHLIKGIFLTHGHEDHIGGVPYLLQQLKAPLYATPLTMTLIEGKLQEFGLLGKVELKVMRARESVVVGEVEVEFIRVCHSIADSVAVAVHTPNGTVLYTGDYKFDQTPIDGELTDYFRLAELGEEGLMVMMGDSTNVNRKGFTPSERMVTPVLDQAFREAKARIIVTTFASNIHRVQQILDVAAKYGRKVGVLGRSMVNVTQRAGDLGFLKFEPGLIVPIEELNHLPHEKVVILTTGSQGEPMSALTRIANNDHRSIQLVAGDTVIISAIAIPGNERSVGKTINRLYAKGAEVIYESVVSGTHVSGHGSEEELKQMLAYTRPKFFIPMHGEMRHLVRHAALATKMGVDPDRIFVLERGDVVEIDGEAGHVVGTVPASAVFVADGRLSGFGPSVLKERRLISEEGIVTAAVTLGARGELLAGPDLQTKGFVEQRQAAAVLEEAKRKITEALEICRDTGVNDRERIRRAVHEALSRSLREQTSRKPTLFVQVQMTAGSQVPSLAQG